MKKFKNVFLLAVMAVSTMCVTSCGEDDDNANGGGSLSITAVVENGNDYNGLIDEVRVTVWGDDESTLAIGKYANGGFTVVLPETVSDTYLDEIESVLYTGTPSDANAKALRIDFSNFRPYKSGEEIRRGLFTYQYEFVYVDRNVNLTGEDADGKWAVSLKKGWNYYVGGEGHFGGHSTTPPSSDVYWWNFYEEW